MGIRSAGCIQRNGYKFSCWNGCHGKLIHMHLRRNWRIVAYIIERCCACCTLIGLRQTDIEPRIATDKVIVSWNVIILCAKCATRCVGRCANQRNTFGIRIACFGCIGTYIGGIQGGRIAFYRIQL